MRRCSTSLVIREMQIQPPNNLFKKVPSVGEGVEKLEFLHSAGGDAKWRCCPASGRCCFRLSNTASPTAMWGASAPHSVRAGKMEGLEQGLVRRLQPHPLFIAALFPRAKARNNPRAHRYTNGQHVIYRHTRMYIQCSST